MLRYAQVRSTFPSLAAVGAVFWFDSAPRLKAACKAQVATKATKAGAKAAMAETAVLAPKTANGTANAPSGAASAAGRVGGAQSSSSAGDRAILRLLHSAMTSQVMPGLHFPVLSGRVRSTAEVALAARVGGAGAGAAVGAAAAVPAAAAPVPAAVGAAGQEPASVRRPAVLTASLPAFCASFGCSSPHDAYSARFNSHPHEWGSAAFADLVIWQVRNNSAHRFAYFLFASRSPPLKHIKSSLRGIVALCSRFANYCRHFLVVCVAHARARSFLVPSKRWCVPSAYTVRRSGPCIMKKK